MANFSEYRNLVLISIDISFTSLPHYSLFGQAQCRMCVYAMLLKNETRVEVVDKDMFGNVGTLPSIMHA